MSIMLDLEFLHGGRSRVHAVSKSVGTTTMDCLSCMAQVQLIALQTGQGLDLVCKLQYRPYVTWSVSDS